MYSIALKHRSFNSNARKLDSSDYLLEAGYLRLRQIVVKRITANGMSIGSAVLQSSPMCPTRTQTQITLLVTCAAIGRIYALRTGVNCGLKILFRL